MSQVSRGPASEAGALDRDRAPGPPRPAPSASARGPSPPWSSSASIGVVGLRLAAARRPPVRRSPTPQDAPWLFAALLPLLVAVVVATIADTGMDAKAVAMLGVLAAVGAALRPLGAGTAGLEPMFFLMVLSGRVLGPGFGFVLGSVTMFASALLTGGVGPVDAVPDAGDGLVHDGRRACCRAPERLRGRAELLMLAAYGFVAAFAYGTVMNLQGWPFIGGLASGISFAPGRPGPDEPGPLRRVLPGDLARLGPGPGGR